MAICFSLVCETLTQADLVNCEAISNYKWNKEELKACWLDKKIVINSTDLKISSPRDETITGLILNENKKIFYLPIAVHEKYPNLIIYVPAACSLISISRDNFRNLNRLKLLWLSGNPIKKINSDTFQDLKSLEELHLSKLICYSRFDLKQFLIQAAPI